MNKYPNPYTPGAGFMPAYLAGRETTINEAKKYMISLRKRYPQNSVIYYGLRGVGKTVLLNRIEQEADELEIMYEHIEISETGKNFIKQVSNATNKFIRKMSVSEVAKELALKAATILKSFKITYNAEDNSFSAGLENVVVGSSGDLSYDLTELFVALGNTANKSGETVCFFIDEIQYMSVNEMEALVNAIHRINQLRLPIMIFGAGLPKILKTLGEVKSYSERLFRFVNITALKKEEAREAITNPPKDYEVSFTNKAVEKILSITEGYPYFIQEFCYNVWDMTDNMVISDDDVNNTVSTFEKRLDEGFFKVRYDRCTKKEKEFMIAMVKCGKLPCTISNVASIMQKKVSAISLIRGNLIYKGLIYSTDHAEIDFTVPQFDKFIIRVSPTLAI